VQAELGAAMSTRCWDFRRARHNGGVEPGDRAQTAALGLHTLLRTPIHGPRQIAHSQFTWNAGKSYLYACSTTIVEMFP